MRTRISPGVGACTALLLAAVPMVAANPAYAAAPRAGGADLAVRIDGATMPSTAAEKVVTATVTNHGPGVARNVVLRVTGWVDSETINPRSVDFCPPGGAEAAPAPTVAPSLEVRISRGCDLAELRVGGSVTLRAVLRGATNAVGAAGSITAEVAHSQPDPVPANDTVTTPLTLAGSTDQRLYARSWDAPVGGTGALRPVPPGHTGDLRFEVGNKGGDLVGGMTVTLRLPAHVRFAETTPGCSYGPDGRGATCTYADLPVVPAAGDTDPTDGAHSALRFRHRMEVSATAPAPARLDGGRVSVVPLETGYLPGAGPGTPSAALPPHVTGLRARDFRGSPESVDFTVQIGPPGDDVAPGGEVVPGGELVPGDEVVPGGDEGAVPGAGEWAGPGDEGAGLPVTGGAAARIVAVGAILVVAGLILFPLARRRRFRPDPQAA